MFDPVAYLMGAASSGGGGGGGGSSTTLILNYKYSQQAGDPAYEYDHTITIQTAGRYLIVAAGYVTSLTVDINGTTDPNYFDRAGDYAHMYNDEKALNVGDTVRIRIASSGRTAVSVIVIKTA